MKKQYKKEYLDVRNFDELPLFAQRVRKLLDFYCISAATLSERTGISPSVIKKYLNEDVDVGIKNMCRIADALDASVDYLVGRTEYVKLNPTAVAACKYTGLTEDAVRMLHTYKDRQENDPDFSVNEPAVLSEFISSGTLFRFSDNLQNSIYSINELIDTHKRFIQNADDYTQYRLGKFEAIDVVTDFVKEQLREYDDEYNDLFDKCMRILHPEEYDNS